MSGSERRIEALEAALERERAALRAAEAELEKLRRLLKSQLQTGLALEFEGIVLAETGDASVRLRWDMMAAEVAPADAREQGFRLIRVAEWADLDSTMFKALRDDFGEGHAREMLAVLRRARGDGPNGVSR